MGTSVRPSIVRSGLLVYLDAGNRLSHPGSGTTWRDLSGNGYNATGVNSPGFTTSNLGATVLNGTSQYFTLPTGVTVSSTAGFTLSCTYRITMTGTNQPVLFQVRTSPANVGYVILFGTQGGGFNAFTVGINNPPSAVTATTTPTAAVTGSWHNITITNDGGGLNVVASTRAYLDGVSLPLATGGSFSGIVNSSVLGTVNSGFTDRYINGNIAQFLAYTRVLSQQEVVQNYNALKTRYGLL